MNPSFSFPLTNDPALPDTVTTDAFEILYCREEEVLKISWGANISTETVQNGYDAAIMYLKTYDLKKILVNLPLSEPVSADKMMWFFKVIVPKIINCTNATTFLALVVPVDFYNALSDDMVTVNTLNQEEMLIIEHFLLPEMGLDWLKSLG